MKIFHRAGVSSLFSKRAPLTVWLVAVGLLAISVAFVLSPPGASVWAWYQSPVSPIFTVSPVLTQPPPTTARPPVVVTITPTEIPSALETQPPQSSGRSVATLVVGGIVLVGLVVGAVVLLMRGQPPDESTP